MTKRLDYIKPKPTTRDCNWHNSGSKEHPWYVNCAVSAVICFNNIVPKWDKEKADDEALEWLQKIRHKLVSDQQLDYMDRDRLNTFHNAWFLMLRDYRWFDGK